MSIRLGENSVPGTKVVLMSFSGSMFQSFRSGLRCQNRKKLLKDLFGELSSVLGADITLLLVLLGLLLDLGVCSSALGLILW